MEKLLSYHNDQAVKDKYVERFARHRAADEVIQGTGYENGRGCFVGCTLDAYKHDRFPKELGVPTWMAHLADRIFEGIPKAEAPQFGTDLLDAIPVGANLEPVRHMLTIRRMDRLIKLLDGNTYPKVADVIAALKMTRDCAEAELGGNTCDWAAAADAARTKAYQAERDDLLELVRGLTT